MQTRLTCATLNARLLKGFKGRVIASARNQHCLVDAPVMLGGPNEAMTPVDLLLAALTSHAIFVGQHAAQQAGIPLQDMRLSAQADYDPRGVVGESVYPGLQALHLRFELDGPTTEQAEMLVQAVRSRCPIYATLARAVTIQDEIILQNPPAAAAV